MSNLRRSGARKARLAAAAAALMILPLIGAGGLATAAPSGEQSGSKIERVEGSGRQVTAYVYSASMGKTIPVKVQRPMDSSVPRPTLYLLNGAGGGEDSATWQRRTDVATFFADKNVNVVTPVGGAFSYYTDWQKDDPKLGRNKWATFLTKELPGLIDSEFKANGVNSMAAISMTGTSVLNLAIAAPGLYKSVASYSGCAETSTDMGRAYIKMVVESRGGAKVENMWGAKNDAAWVANDPVVNAEKLRGTQLYISSGNGLPGAHDNLEETGGISGLANQALLGGVIEGATLVCTNNLSKRLGELGIPAVVDFRPNGTHSWGYWQDDLHKSWPMLAASIGL
ncbi:diacylglycerol O-acyltransferase/trehalose O-mycolyltransferase [Rhodococcus sp. PvR044]|jgi:diacylglycerol O-acyltransferase / trehalose O-mycolyltransferase|uniref:alpha/beta hydrolase n=1 Tax=Rhodococcus TaxID=1827 RepID=UPI000BD0665C|nr:MULTISPECIES: alpha/beta hydrolase family protein [Rhodococcus]MBP1162375.1 S-formylglutathione hydrolase FrmB [Rhodococcus sp. PvR099]MCZ4555062.1 alpha/beta hydrolase family protein [Rhodococcus maanshanensis]PTR45088.1 S-formylglutathione hydrolase FrmB [Rhodococcus sp. OK611]SNX89423.1 S-formylglutathione hydrolase FrmB [Rhodococcus sp. OK270]